MIHSSTPGYSKWYCFVRFTDQNCVCTSPLPHTCYIAAHLILLDFITRIMFGGEYGSRSSSWYSFLHPPSPPSLLGSRIFLSTLFKNTLSLCSNFNVTDQVSHPYRTWKITPLYILTFIFLDSKLEYNRLCTEWLQESSYFNLLLISTWIEFWFVQVVPQSLSYYYYYYY